MFLPEASIKPQSPGPTVKDIDILKIQVKCYLNGAANYK